jgi:hypothetical protein
MTAHAGMTGNKNICHSREGGKSRYITRTF